MPPMPCRLISLEFGPAPARVADLPSLVRQIAARLPCRVGAVDAGIDPRAVGDQRGEQTQLLHRAAAFGRQPPLAG